MAVAQLRNPTEGCAYFDRKVAGGKTPMEAMRALKRRLPTSSTTGWSPTPWQR
jgi:transposase